MDPKNRVVTRMPLEKIWTEDGVEIRTRGKGLTAREISDLLRQGPVNFAVADVGQPLRWVAAAESCQFWKNEVSTHLAEPGSKIVLDSFPDSYCYVSSQWCLSELTVILLERSH